MQSGPQDDATRLITILPLSTSSLVKAAVVSVMIVLDTLSDAAKPVQPRVEQLLDRDVEVFDELADRGTDLNVSLGGEGRDVGKKDATTKPRKAAMAAMAARLQNLYITGQRR